MKKKKEKRTYDPAFLEWLKENYSSAYNSPLMKHMEAAWIAAKNHGKN